MLRQFIKIIPFLFLSSICFASGNMTIQQGSGGGTVTIQQATGGGGAGTLTSVNAGAGIISNSPTGPSVTISLDQNATNYIRNSVNPQFGATAYPQYAQIASSETIYGPLVFIPTGTAINPLFTKRFLYSQFPSISGIFDSKNVYDQVVLNRLDGGNYVSNPNFYLYVSSTETPGLPTTDPAAGGWQATTAQNGCPNIQMFANGSSSSSISAQCNGLFLSVGPVQWTWPTADGSSGQFLKTNGSGVLSFGTASGSGSPSGPDSSIQSSQNGLLVGTGTLTLNTTNNTLIAGTTSEFTNTVFIGTIAPVASQLNLQNQLNVNIPTTAEKAATVIVTTSTTQVNLVLEEAAPSQTSDALDIVNSGGSTKFSVSASGVITTLQGVSANLGSTEIGSTNAGGQLLFVNLSNVGNSSVVVRGGATASGSNVYIQGNVPVLTYATFTAAGNNLIATTISSFTVSGPTFGIFDADVDAAQFKLPGASSPYISNSTTEFSASIYFDDTSTQNAQTTVLVKKYDGRPLSADILFTSTATTGYVCWGIYTATNTPNSSTNNYDSSTFNVNVTTAIPVNTNQLALSVATVALSNTSTHNGDLLTIKVERETGGCGNTEAVGFGRMKKLRIYE